MYIIRDKTYVERVLDTEFIVEESDTGYFFSGNTLLAKLAIDYTNDGVYTTRFKWNNIYIFMNVNNGK